MKTKNIITSIVLVLLVAIVLMVWIWKPEETMQAANLLHYHLRG